MGEHKAVCPACNNAVTAEDEMTLVKSIQEHAKEHHGMELSEEKAKEMIAQQSG
jgi:predicted small metal-binding protein